MIGRDLPLLCEAEWMKCWDLWLPFLKILYNHILLAALGLSQVLFLLGCPQNAVEENWLQNLAEKGSCQRLAENEMDYVQYLTKNEMNYVQCLTENEMDYGQLGIVQMFLLPNQ